MAKLTPSIEELRSMIAVALETCPTHQHPIAVPYRLALVHWLEGAPLAQLEHPDRAAFAARSPKASSDPVFVLWHCATGIEDPEERRIAAQIIHSYYRDAALRDRGDSWGEHVRAERAGEHSLAYACHLDYLEANGGGSPDICAALDLPEPCAIKGKGGVKRPGRCEVLPDQTKTRPFGAPHWAAACVAPHPRGRLYRPGFSGVHRSPTIRGYRVSLIVN